MVLYCSFCNLLGAKISKEIINIKTFLYFFILFVYKTPTTNVAGVRKCYFSVGIWKRESFS